MVVCNFYLQGRCRYGEKCWNEHPRGGSRGGGGYNDGYRGSGQQQSRGGGGGGGGGFGNRVWVNPSQQRGRYIQPSSFSSQGRSDWSSEDGGREGGGGGGRRDNLKSSEFSFSAQNRFSAFNPPNAFDRGGRGIGRGVEGTAVEEDDDKKLEIIQMDMDVWESSRQWAFSCYSYFKTPISGFTDWSPEELRLQYYSTRASGELQSYHNGINQLLSQWKNRVQELKNMSASTRSALLAELNGTAPPSGFGSTSSGFGSSTTGFGSSTTGFGSSTTGFGSSTTSFGSQGFGASAATQASAFSFTSSQTGFGSSAAPSSSSSSSSSVFGSALAPATQPPSGFGSSSTSSASTFSFAPPTADKPAAPSGFGSAPGFGFSSAGGGFGSGFGASAPTAAGGSSVAQTSGGFGAATALPAAEAGSVGGPLNSLYSPESKLTEEELNQFKAKRFTLGQIPLKPPPANMLMV